MNNSNFTYIAQEYPELAKIGLLAERNIFNDPNTSLSKLRVLTEKIINFIIDYEGIEDTNYKDNNSKIQLLQYENVTPPEINDLLHKIRKAGNKASHQHKSTTAEAKFMLRQAVKVVQWFYAVYEEEVEVPDFIVPTNQVNNSYKIKELETELSLLREEAVSYKAKLEKLKNWTEEQKKNRKARASRAILKKEETEWETRERIDQQLRDAGWECDTKTINFKTCKTLPEKGRFKAIAEWKCGSKWADYALFNGLELIGIVEAKKHIKNVMSDLGQAKVYSQQATNAYEVTFPEHPNKEQYPVPFLFATNGRKYLEQIKIASGIWFWDGRKPTNRARPLQAWFSPEDLIEKLHYDQIAAEENLLQSDYDYLTNADGLSLRAYQIEAIKAVENKILQHPEDRRALVAMATGTGKTRTIIGLCYRLIKAGRFRRILFLVDRRMLGEQAADAFKELKIEGLQTFAQIYDLQEITKAAAELDTKIHFATVQAMVQRVVYADQPPSIGDYDCIVVDEAHRGYTLDKEMEEEELILRDQRDFQSKYRMVLDYFDAYRIGLTATPAVHTAEIFGKPVFTYSYRKAVTEGYLIDFEPPFVFETKLGKNGIVWEQGDEVKIYDPEENEIIEAGVTEDEIRVDIAGFNKRVINDSFNRNIITKLIADYGIHPDDKKKTLIFAATNLHADMIVDIFREELENLGEEVDEQAIVKITGEVYNRKELLLKYKNDLYPSIVVTVDLLSTGIDVPPICNIVFLRRVNSRILYDQMMGRATRKCAEIGKEVFKVYDAVGVTKIMAKEKVMKPVAPLVTKTFVDLAEEIALLEDEYLQEAKLDRIIAKLQRKTRTFDREQMERFISFAEEPSVKDFGQKLKALEPSERLQAIAEYDHLWNYLDREKGRGLNYGTLYSEHVDDILEVNRAFDKNLKPKDYIESFTTYIQQNMNEVAALKIVCTKPNSLTRKELKKLKFLLDEQGYNDLHLNTAYKMLTNEEIVADIITHIRTAALSTTLISHEERVNKAITQLKNNHSWNQIQLKWLDRIRDQLLQESIITIEDLNQPPFSNDGGLKRLDKIFKNQTTAIIRELNEYLYHTA